MSYYPYQLIDIRAETPTAFRLTIAPTGDSFVRYQPGQYVAISFKQDGNVSQARCFSITSAPNANGILELGIRVSGPFSEAISQLKPGTPITVYGPYGQMIFDSQRHQNLVLIAGGIGITPFMSMIRQATANRLANNLTLIYSNRTATDVPYAQDLKSLVKANPHLQAALFLTQNTTPVTGFNLGRVDAKSLTDVIGSKLLLADYFICGPEPFMKAVVDSLTDLGVPAEKIQFDSFGFGQESPAKKSYALAGTAYTASVLSILGLAAFFGLSRNVNAATTPSVTTDQPPAEDQSRTSTVEDSQKEDQEEIEDDLSTLQNQPPKSPTVKPKKTATATSIQTPQTHLS